MINCFLNISCANCDNFEESTHKKNEGYCYSNNIHECEYLYDSDNFYCSKFEKKVGLTSKSCVTCSHYDFEDDTQQICTNINNYQLLDENWYKMMVTPDFCCNEWEKHNEQKTK